MLVPHTLDVSESEIYRNPTHHLIGFFKGILLGILDENEFKQVFINRTINGERKGGDCEYTRKIFTFYRYRILKLQNLPYDVSHLSDDANILFLYFISSQEALISKYEILEILCNVSQTIKELNDFFQSQGIEKRIVSFGGIGWQMQHIGGNKEVGDIDGNRGKGHINMGADIQKGLFSPDEF